MIYPISLVRLLEIKGITDVNVGIFFVQFDCVILKYNLFREHPLMTSDIRVGRGSKIAPKIGRYRVGQGR